MLTGVHESPRLYSAIVTMMMIIFVFMVMLNKNYDIRNTSERSSFASVVFFDDDYDDDYD